MRNPEDRVEELAFDERPFTLELEPQLEEEAQDSVEVGDGDAHMVEASYAGHDLILPPAAPEVGAVHPESAEDSGPVILPKVKDPRLVTIRRGGTLTDADHHLLALWAATCAEHVLGLFEAACPEDPRPRDAIEHARAWVRGEVAMMTSRAAGGHAMGAARDLRGAPRYAAYAAGQAACVAHVAAHDLGAAAYAIKAVRAAAIVGGDEAAGPRECRWQRDQLPDAVRELVVDDQQRRNDICWSVFDVGSGSAPTVASGSARRQVAVPE